MIVLASPNPTLRESYRECLQGSYRVLEVPNLTELTRILKSEQPDIVFLQPAILLPKPQAALRTLCLQYPRVPFVVFGCPDDRAFYLSLLSAGARGLLPYSSAPGLAAKVIEVVARGELWLSRRTLGMFLSEVQFAGGDELPGSRDLSEREVQVGRIAAAGLSNKEIARSLGISERTVKAHISRVFVKLGFRDRSELMLLNRNRDGDPGVMSPNVEDQVARERNRATGRLQCVGTKTCCMNSRGALNRSDTRNSQRR